MSQLRETNQTLGFFCDFDKISNNVENIKLSLCMLNSLIGTNDLRRSVETIWERDKTAFNILDILIAVRSNGQKKVLNANGECVVLDSFFESVDSVVEYLEDTGLAHILKEGRIKNLVDYVFGIETGLDSNARKNRSGHVMENMISKIFDDNLYNVCNCELYLWFWRFLYSYSWKLVNIYNYCFDNRKWSNFTLLFYLFPV